MVVLSMMQEYQSFVRTLDFEGSDHFQCIRKY